MEIEINHKDVVFGIEFDYQVWSGRKGSRDSYGVPMEPDDLPDIEIYDVFITSACSDTYDVRDRPDLFELFDGWAYDQVLELAANDQIDWPSEY